MVGTSGVGKTTLSAAIADRLGLAHTEIDSLYHGPNWVPRPEFMDDVHAFIAGEEWVTEWQYSQARPAVATRATLAVWLDYPVRVRMARNIRRTVRRRLRRERLWNDNIERPLKTFFTDREHIIRWAWRTRHMYDDLPDRLVELGRADLPIVRLGSQDEADLWLASLPLGDGG